jgi:integral membrane sensor domain MASE1/anti-sigma regulatory factor (Ser/Thr protein kinase)
MAQSKARNAAVYVAWILVVAIAYVLFAKIGLLLASTQRQVTPLWPPTGIAIAALVLGGSRLWPGVFLGALAANAYIDEPLYTMVGIAIGNTLAPFAGAYFLRFFRFDRTFSRVRDVAVFVLFGSILAMLISATNGTLQLGLAHLMPWASFGATWRLWWIGDAAGVLLVAPFILTWRDAGRDGIVQGDANALELAILIVATFGFSIFEFFGRVPMAFPLYPFIVWAALRAGIRPTTALMVVVSGFALFATAHGLGPFNTVSVEQRATGFILYIAVLAITGLVLSALTAERRSALVKMQVAERRFQVLAETVPQIVWTADRGGTIDWFNQRWHQFAGEDELSSGFPDWRGLIASGAPFERELRLRRADGVSRWFLVRAEPMRDDRGQIVRWYGTHTDIDDQRRALERTSRIATTLQSAFLPQTLPEHPHVRFDALYLTAGQEVLIGGDWYDAFAIPGGRIVVSIGDVTGHGLNAAVSAGRIRQSIVATAIDVHDPAEILTKVNRLLQFHDSTVATALVAVIEPDTLTMRYASAGHPSPIHAGANRAAHALPHGSLPLGVSHTPDYRSYNTSLAQNDVVVFYTDGITEFQRDIDATERALQQAVDTVAASPSSRPAERIRRAVLGEAAPIDDAVLVVLRVAAASEDGSLDDELNVHRSWSFHSSHAYSAHNARHEVMRFIQELADSDEELFTAELIVGEILANTVEHAPGLVSMEIDWSDSAPIVTVVDTGPGLERFAVHLPEDALTEDGRGLYLVQTLARDVCIESDRGYGTKMTVTLPIERRRRSA